MTVLFSETLTIGFLAIRIRDQGNKSIENENMTSSLDDGTMDSIELTSKYKNVCFPRVVWIDGKSITLAQLLINAFHEASMVSV